MFDRLRDSWERLGTRERRLFSLLGITVVVCGILYVGFMIQDGLSDLEKHNDDTRAVLSTLDARRDELLEAKSKHNEAVGQIGDEPIALATYLEKVGGEAGVQIRAQKEKPTVSKSNGKFHQHSIEITLFDVTLDQLAHFLRSIETQSPIVVTERLSIKRSTMVKEKLDKVDITVATYSRPGAKKPAAGAAAAPAEGEAKP
jgi:hypothetical protein